MIFESTEAHDHWQKVWSAKEEATKNRLVRSLEKCEFEEHAKELKPQAETLKSGIDKGQ